MMTGVAGPAAAAIAEKAARQGAKIVMADTDEQRLQWLEQEIRRFSDAVLAFSLAGYDEGEMHRLALGALGRHGRIDSWIDSLGPRLSSAVESDEGDAAKGECRSPEPFLTCSRIAQEYLAGEGGAMVTIAVPELSGRAFRPAIAALLDAVGIRCCTLRKELELKGLPIAMALIRPAPADDAFASGSSGWKTGAAACPDSVSCPSEAVAAAALYAAQHPARDIYVGIAAPTTTLHYTPCSSETNILQLSASPRRHPQGPRQGR